MIARNYRVWLTLAHQEMFQFDERTQKTLLTMGTQIFGSTSDLDAAINLARTFYKIDPYLVKRYEPMYSSHQGITEVIDHRPVEFSIEEQHLMQAYRVKEQPAFHFLVRPAPGEGDATGGVYPVTIRNFDRNMWPNEELVGQARAILSKRSGISVQLLLSQIEARRAALSATMNGYAQHSQYIQGSPNPKYPEYPEYSQYPGNSQSSPESYALPTPAYRSEEDQDRDDEYFPDTHPIR